MILGLVFSRDRALQLDACLTSFGRQVTDAESVRMIVLYAASSTRFRRQYQELASEYATRAEFVLEQDFRTQLLGVMKEASSGAAAADGPVPGIRALRRPATEPASPPDCIVFLVDDALFVRRFTLAAAQEALHLNPGALGFSLRLGRNTVQSYVLNRHHSLPEFQSAGPGMLRFNWTKADGDFGYPLEISSSIYRLLPMASLVGSLRFSEPNTLESELSLQARRFRRRYPVMLCPETSVAFSAPVNRVQAVYTNRAGDDPEWSATRLADRFDEGYRLDTGALNGFMPSACHQEVELGFVRLSPNGGR